MPESTQSSNIEFQKYKAIFDNAEDMISYVDFTGRILDVNERVIKFLGCKREDIVGKFFFTVPYFQGATVSVQELVRIFKDNVLRKENAENRMEVGLKSSTGELRYFDVLTGFVRVDGATKFVINIYRDITDNKKRIEEMRKNEMALNERIKEEETLYEISKILQEGTEVDKTIQTIVNAMPKAFLFKDLAEVKITFNGSEFKTEGFNDSEYKIEREIELEEEKKGKVIVAYRSKPEKEVSKDNYFFDEEISLVEAVSDQISNFLIKVSSVKKLEERNKFIEIITNNIPIGIVVISLDKGEIKYLNPKIQELFGWEDSEFKTIDSLLERIAWLPGDAQKFRAEIFDSVKENTTVVRRWEKKFKTIEQKAKYFQIKISPIHEQNLLIIKFSEITEIKNREFDIKKRDAVMQNINQFVGQFLTGGDWLKILNTYLEKWGRLLDVSRVYIFEHFENEGDSKFKQILEWVSEGVSSAFDDPDMQFFSFPEAGVTEWEEKLNNNEHVIGNEMEIIGKPMQEIFTEQQIKTLVIVPIFVDAKLWGFIGFDECRNTREWKEIEINTLDTIAGVLGQVIENSFYEKQLEESNAKLLKSNKELETFNKLMVGRELKMVELKKKLSKYEKIEE